MIAPEHRIYLKRLLILLALVLGARGIMAALLPLSPQEAYYWVFSLHPAWSYFDHPPLTAYAIGFFTYFLGDQAIAIRLGALLLSFGFSLLAYVLGKELFSPRVGFWTAIISTLLPAFAITALIITPDSPLVFFWTLSGTLTLKAIQNDRYRYHLLSGVSLGFEIHGRAFSDFTVPFFSGYPGPEASLETLGALWGLDPGGPAFFTGLPLERRPRLGLLRLPIHRPGPGAG
jgi:hypothetical protein